MTPEQIAKAKRWREAAEVDDRLRLGLAAAAFSTFMGTHAIERLRQSIQEIEDKNPVPELMEQVSEIQENTQGNSQPMVKSLMPRTLAIRIPAGHPTGGRRWQVPVMVDWFPPLTEDELAANAAAASASQHPPYPNPNLLYVHVEVVDAPVTGRDLGDETDGVPV